MLQYAAAYNKAMQALFRNATLNGSKRLLIFEESVLLR